MSDEIDDLERALRDSGWAPKKPKGPLDKQTRQQRQFANARGQEKRKLVVVTLAKSADDFKRGKE